MGPHIGSGRLLHFGANDMGSVMMEENVVQRGGDDILPGRGGALPADPRGGVRAGAAQQRL
jgi:hypothetical protein